MKNEIAVKQIENNHIYDFEFYANELNYIENQKSLFTSQQDIEYFAEQFSIKSINQDKYFN